MGNIPHRRAGGGNRTVRLAVLGTLLLGAGGLLAWRLLSDSGPEKVDPALADRAARIQANIQNASPTPPPDSTPTPKPAEIQKTTTKRGPIQAPK